MSAGRVRGPHDLVLVRHGATPANERGRFQGWGGDGLSEAGRREARRTARWLAFRVARERVTSDDHLVWSNDHPAWSSDLRAWSSDLVRCRQTARLVLPNAHIRLDPRLRELSFGTFEGRSHVELMESADPSYRAWLRGPAACPPPGGESLSALRARVLAWWAERMRSEPDTGGGMLVVVTHGGPAGILLGHLLRPGDPAARQVPEPGGALHLRSERPVAGAWHLLDSRSLPSPRGP